jgi:predicted methyltransferase
MKLGKTLLTAIAMAGLAACATPAGGGGGMSTAARAKADPVLVGVVGGEWRKADHKSRDAARHPVDSLAFWGLKPGMTVLELQPGAEGWWTEILAPYAARTGGKYMVTAADLNNPNISEGARKLRADMEKKFADNKALYGDVTVIGYGPATESLGPNGKADFIITARSVHGWIRGKTVDKVFKDMYDALKPGGILALEQHRANADVTSADQMMNTGYVSEAFVIAAAEKAGFKLAGKSEINANPKDTKDHPFGVWTLPPTARTSPFGQPDDPKFDRTKFDAIGESDRMTLKFVKPKA